MSGSFVFVVTNPSSNRFAKAEVGVRYPELRFAYSRPGLLTWKCEKASPEFGANLVFARVSGQSIGLFESIEEAIEEARKRFPEATCAHVFPRDPHNQEAWAESERLAQLVQAQGLRIGCAQGQELVLDFVVAPKEPLFVGCHRHFPFRWACPGGLPRFSLPEAAPSRGYLKLKEALLWSGIEPRPGEIAIELGASPGGSSWAWLEMGLELWAFDPAPLDPRLCAFSKQLGGRLHFFQEACGAIRRAHLPRKAHYLASDLNLAPQVAMRYVLRTASHFRSFRALFVTLKINDDLVLKALPSIIESLRGMAFGLGLEHVRATHLPSHGREILAVALRKDKP
ncbi:MAG: hypothetical protein NZM37_00890 [Sandaracinaceae bacterium]|nr:hypothetical protein [Sandaracinaceae bacterium]